MLACFNLTSCYGQNHKTSPEPALSKDYLKIVYEHCANPDIIEVESNPNGYIEVEYLCEGKLFEIAILNNSLLFLEHTLSESEIPLDKINLKLDKKYSGWTLDEVSQITTKDTIFLKVEILKDGIEQNLYFTNDGKWFKIKPIDITSNINFNEVEKNTFYKLVKYNFHKPDSVFEMPDLLKEVSGIALSADGSLYCVQDEIGSIFEYDLKELEISNSFRFTDVGDFEDIAIHNNTVYILRSDGNLFVYDLHNKRNSEQTMLQVNSLNIEGMSYNEDHIYIVCKEALVNHPQSKRMVYKVQVDNLQNVEPYLEINIDVLSKFIAENYPELETSKIAFNPSAIAFHPITKEMYILSASDRYIAVYKEKKLINVIPLSAEVLYKPEGLAFYENGDLLISSEGDKKGFIKGSINLLKYE
jgi:uncharacterized protein YjiK